MLSMNQLPITEAVYTFVTGDGEVIHINVKPLLEAVRVSYARLGILPICAQIAPSLRDALEAGTLGVEPDHALTLPESALEVPVLVCEWGATHIIADGAHRLWRRWQRGDSDFPAYLCPEGLWRLFLIDDIPGSAEYWDEFNRTAKVRS